MALSFQNLGFETESSTPGVPDKWSVAFITNSIRYAAFGTPGPLQSAYETFETEWDGNEDSVFEFDLDADVEIASYDPIPQDFEDFESHWADGNQVHYVVMPATALAPYDVGVPEDFEDFEEEWSSNEDDITEFEPGDTDLADYDTGSPEDREDFEEEWSSNEDDIQDFGPGDTALAEYATSEDFEDFETVSNFLQEITIDAVGPDPDEFHIIINGVDVEYQCTGVGDETDIRDLLVGYINAALAGIAIAVPAPIAKMQIKAFKPGDNLTVQIQVTGANAMTLTTPDRTEVWTQLMSLD